MKNHEEPQGSNRRDGFLNCSHGHLPPALQVRRSSQGFHSLMIRDVAQHQVLVLWSNTGVANLSYLARQIAIVLVGGNYNPIHQSLREVLGPVVANEAAVAKYRALEQNQPAAYDFSEDELNEFAYFVMMEGRITDAIELFKLNVERHPNSFNVYDSLGEVYARAGQIQLAKSSFTSPSR